MGRNLGQDRGPSPRAGTRPRRPRPRPVRVGHRRSLRSGSFYCWGFYQGIWMLPRKYRDAEVFGLVDTMGLLVAVVVVAANLSDNAGRYHHFGPCRNQGGPAPKDMARQRVQENLRRSLLRIRHLPRSRGTDRPSLLSGPTPPLGSRTHLGMAHQPPASTNRLRTRPRRNRRIHMGSPHPSTPPPTHPTPRAAQTNATAS